MPRAGFYIGSGLQKLLHVNTALRAIRFAPEMKYMCIFIQPFRDLFLYTVFNVIGAPCASVQPIRLQQ